MLAALLPKLSSPKLSTTLFVLIFSAVLWFAPEWLHLDSTKTSYPLLFMQHYVLFSLPSFWAHLIQFIIIILLLFYVTRVCETLQIIPIRTMMPLFVGLILASSIHYLQYFSASTIAFICLVFSTVELVRMYFYNQMISSAYNIFFLISIASLFVYEYIFLLPIFWFGMIILRSFSIRTFFSSFLGILSPFILLFSFCYLFDNMALLDYYWHIPEVVQFNLLPPATRPDIFYGIVLFVFSLWAIFSYLFMSFNYKLNVRLNFIFIHWSFWLSLVLVFIFLQHFQQLIFVPILYMTLLISLYYATNSSKLSSIVFLVFLFFSLTYRFATLFGV